VTHLNIFKFDMQNQDLTLPPLQPTAQETPLQSETEKEGEKTQGLDVAIQQSL
jgi:hypothetical protein